LEQRIIIENFNHCVSALDNLNLIALVHFGSDITTPRPFPPAKPMRQVPPTRVRSPGYALFRRQPGADVGEECIFNFDYAFFGARTFFSSPQLRRGEALGARKRLPSFVISGNARGISL